MDALKQIYWLRLVLGVTAGIICVSYNIVTGTLGEPELIEKLLNGISIAIIFYILTYYIIKFKYMNKVEKKGKLYTMGIGIYFISWIVFWILLYTIAKALLLT
jgi:hypothetical protein